MSVKRIMFSVLIVFALVVSAEVSCDLFTLLQDTLRLVAGKAPEGAVMLSSKYVPWFFQPSQTNKVIPASGTRVNINLHGFRGGEPDTRRPLVACLGDSVTFGWNASDDAHTYPGRLAALLDPRGVSVVNAGMPAWNSANLLTLYALRVSPLHPRITIIMCGWNDLREMLAKDSRRVIAPRPAEAMVQHFALSRALTRLHQRLGWAAVARREAMAPTTAGTLVPPDRLDEYALLLRALVEGVRADPDGMPVLMTLPNFLKDTLSDAERRLLLPDLIEYPQLTSRGWAELLEEMNQRVRAVARELDVRVVEAGSIRDVQLFADICHLNDEGNARLAQLVADSLDGDPKFAGILKAGSRSATPRP